jgi:hypothetical protein
MIAISFKYPPRLVRIITAFFLAISASLCSAADISWTGTVGLVGPIPFGGAPYCNYQVSLQNLQMVLTLSANSYSSSVQCLVVEESLNGCPHPPNPPNTHHYTAASANITKTGNNIHIVYSPNPLNNPQCSLFFDGIISGNSIFGDLTFHRADQLPPLDWIATPFIEIFTTPPQITCPGPITVCPSEGTDPNVTGFPTLDFSCSPPAQVDFDFTDGPEDFNGTFVRTWTATDPICGTSASCTQFITVQKQDDPDVTVSSSNDGLILILEATGTRGFITESTWTLNFDVLSEGNGVHFVSPATVEIDLNVYNLPPGQFSVFVNVKTSCTAQGGGGSSGSNPQPYSLSRTFFSAPSASPGSGNRPFKGACDVQTSYGPTLRTFRFRTPPGTAGAGAALIKANSPTARLAAISPGASLTAEVTPTLACGTQAVRFLADSDTTYSIIVEATENFTLTSQLFDPTRTIALSGNLAFSTVGTGTQTTRTLTISNEGTLPLNVTSITYPQGYSGNWSGGFVQPGTPQDVIVTLNPPTVGNYNGTIIVNSDALSGNKTIAVTGNALVISTKTLSLSGDLAFGAVEVGSSKKLNYTIMNTGNTVVNVSGIQYPLVFNGNWSGTIVPGASQAIAVTFSPLAAINYSGNVTVTSDATSITPLSISGNGIQPIAPPASGSLDLSGNLDFGTVTTGTTARRSFKISNTNLFAVTVSKISYPSDFSGDWNGGALGPGTSKTVTVQFSPNQEVFFIGAIIVTSDAPVKISSISVSGKAIAALTRTIALSGNLAFGNVPVGTSTTGTLSIENRGNSPLTVTGILYPEAVTGDFSGAPMQIPPLGTSNVNINFNPKRSGTYAGNIEVSSNATDGVNTFSIQGVAFTVGFIASPLRPPANGLFELTVGVPAGRRLILEASRDFRSWRTVSTRSTFGGEMNLLDPVPNGDPGQFYRFRLE